LINFILAGLRHTQLISIHYSHTFTRVWGQDSDSCTSLMALA